MIIKPRNLEVKVFKVNSDYLDKYKTLSNHTFVIEETINKIGGLKRELLLKITVLINSKEDNINIVKGVFTKFFEIQLHTDENAKSYSIIFISEVSEMISSVREYLLDNIPPEIVGIEPPLIDGTEAETKARLIYDLLIK